MNSVSVINSPEATSYCSRPSTRTSSTTLRRRPSGGSPASADRRPTRRI
ncbi:MAG: hypothetical protein MZV64_29800 [Ignavibacteriales bacterium]|nr:hypothetical protein [Ignavibacteriales bacterium]